MRFRPHHPGTAALIRSSGDDEPVPVAFLPMVEAVNAADRGIRALLGAPPRVRQPVAFARQDVPLRTGSNLGRYPLLYVDTGTRALLEARLRRWPMRNVEVIVGTKPVDATGETLFGGKSVSDLEDLIRLNDMRVAETKKSYQAFSTAWQARNPIAWNAWTRDWNDLLQRYKKASDAAGYAIISSQANPLPKSMIPAGAAYEAVARSVQQIPMKMTKGDLTDLMGRLRQAGQAVDESKTQQPSAPDLSQYNPLSPTNVEAAVAPWERIRKQEEDALAKAWTGAKPYVIGIGALTGVALLVGLIKAVKS
jgi:hypothetical protein